MKLVVYSRWSISTFTGARLYRGSTLAEFTTSLNNEEYSEFFCSGTKQHKDVFYFFGRSDLLSNSYVRRVASTASVMGKKDILTYRFLERHQKQRSAR